jgi:MFS family permease
MASLLTAIRRGPLARAAHPKADAAAASPTSILVPLAMAQFLASYDTSSMNVAITNIAADLDTTVTGVQTTITLFTLTMAALMITGSKLSDILGRKRCFIAGIWTYGAGALITALAPTIGVMALGFSILEGIGSALMIPPIYILVTVTFDDVKSRAKAFGIVSGMAGLGSAAGPLIGGTITTTITWRASFAAEVAVIVVIWLLARRRIQEPPISEPKRTLDVSGATLSAAAMASIVLGILLANNYGWFTARQDFGVGDFVILPKGSMSPVWLFVGLGVLLMAWFWIHIRRRERHGREPLLATRLFHNRTSNLGLITQMMQWFMIVGGMFVISVFLQVSREYSAVKTGLVLTPTTAGILLSSAAAERLARKRSQRFLIRSGFAIAIAGITQLLIWGDATSNPLWLAPGLFLLGIGIGVMLTASVNTVQTSFPDEDQGEISGVSRSVSNLGSSVGVAVAGAVLISSLIAGVTARAQDSTVLTESQQAQLGDALEHQVSALSDTQVREALDGQPQPVVDEVERINRESRNQAIGFSLIAVAVAGLIGFTAAMFLPAAPAAQREDDQPPPGA